MLILTAGTVGRIICGLVFILCSFTAAFSFASYKCAAEPAERIALLARRAVAVAALLGMAAVVLMGRAFVFEDFSLAAVARTCPAEMSAGARLSALWLSCAGSMLVWSASAMFFFVLWQLRSRVRDHRFQTACAAFGSAICAALWAIIVFLEKPFAPSLINSDAGAGARSLFESSWVVFHPPAILLAYGALVVPFAVAAAAILAGGTEDSRVYGQIRGWLLFAIFGMALGVAGGSRWAYNEAGWGGYWSWGAVEASSLLPLLAAIMALHCLTGMRSSERFRFYAFVIMPSPFVLALLASFAARGGLDSQHGFAETPFSAAMLILAGLCAFAWFVLAICAGRTIPVKPPQLGTPILQRTGLLFWACVLLTGSIAAITVGVFWPLLSEFFIGSKVVVGRSFYDIVVSIAGVVLAFLVGLSLLAELRKRDNFILYAMGCSGVGLIVYGIIFKQSEVSLIMALASGVCAFSTVAVVIVILLNFIEKGRVGAHVAHLGFLLLVVSAGFSSGEKKVEKKLEQGDVVSFAGYDFKYQSFEEAEADFLKLLGPEIQISSGSDATTVWPHARVYADATRKEEKAVMTGLLEDVSVRFLGRDKNGRVELGLTVKPLMGWVWTGMILIVVGLAMGWLESRYIPEKVRKISELDSSGAFD